MAQSSPQKDTTEQTSDEGDFNWDTYLKETASISAPSECFRQSEEVPPVNDFKVGMKLEARDPDKISSVCIASVIATSGARLCLRLDGGGSQKDFWRLVDSSDIQPVGTCERNGELLQPPLGSQMSASSWKKFLLKTLTDADLAPAEFFKKEPPKPPVNNFKVGMKLEAVDRKNPHLICPATIGAVKGDQVHITLDGWSTTFDYWCSYDSRDIFPIGWCFLTRDFFHPPGNIVVKKPKPKSSRVAKPLKDGGAQAPVPSVKSMGKTSFTTKVKPSRKMIVVLPPFRAKKSGHTTSSEASSDPEKDSTLKTITAKKGGAKPRKQQEKGIPVVPSTSSASLRSLMRRTRRESVEIQSEIGMSTVEEETAAKESMKQSAQDPVPCSAPVSAKLPKMTVPASKEEVLSLEGEEHGMPEEETFSVDSKNSSGGDCLKPAVPSVSPRTTEIVPSTLSPSLVEEALATQSTCEDTALRVEMTPEGN